MPLYRRLPKRGFLPHGGRTEFEVVNIRSLEGFPPGSVVDPEALVARGLIKRSARDRVKILGQGDLGHAITVKVHAVSESARRKIEAAGGRLELIGAAASA
jgi:large subunit ribosomal protein L15